MRCRKEAEEHYADAIIVHRSKIQVKYGSDRGGFFWPRPPKQRAPLASGSLLACVRPRAHNCCWYRMRRGGRRSAGWQLATPPRSPDNAAPQLAHELPGRRPQTERAVSPSFLSPAEEGLLLRPSPVFEVTKAPLLWPRASRAKRRSCGRWCWTST